MMLFSSPGMTRCFASKEEQYSFYARATRNVTRGPLPLNSNAQFLEVQDIWKVGPWVHLQEKVVEHCLEHTNTSMLKYVGTAATVRDLAAMADAFDGPGSKINFWGIGPGAMIGSFLLKSE